MKMHSVFCPGALKTISLWLAILSLSLILFTGFIIPAHAAGSGWVEARVTVPSGFEQNVIVTVVNSETGDEYATRLMKVNDYVSFFSLPAGNYNFDGAFLENSDFRYNVNLTNGVETFNVSGQDDAPAVLLSFNTTYNSAYSDGAKPTEPPVTTEPISTQSGSEETIAVEIGNNKPAVTKPGVTAGAQLPVNTEATESNTTSTGSSQETAPFESDTVTEPGNQDIYQPGTTADSNSSQHNVKDTAEQEETSVETEKTEEPLSLGKKLLYGFIATVVFGLVVFGLAYLYRRHWENS